MCVYIACMLKKLACFYALNKLGSCYILLGADKCFFVTLLICGRLCACEGMGSAQVAGGIRVCANLIPFTFNLDHFWSGMLVGRKGGGMCLSFWVPKLFLHQKYV